MVKKEYGKNGKKLNEGESWIRVGTSKRRITRSDLETIYKNRRSPLEIKLRDRLLFINDQNPAKLEFLITNTSGFDRVFTEALMSIEDENENQLTVVRMTKFTSNGIVQEGSYDSDFSLSVPKKSEIHE